MVLDVGDGDFRDRDDHWQVRSYCERGELAAKDGKVVWDKGELRWGEGVSSGVEKE